MKSRTLGVILYEGFELLDVFGPAEMFGSVGPELTTLMLAEEAGPVRSAQGPQVLAEAGFASCPELDLILLPGGIGTIRELENDKMLEFLRKQTAAAEIVTSVCSGSAILAKAGVLDGRRATSNKQFFSIASSQSEQVDWVTEARWVQDGKFVTSSGVSAGMDMALSVIEGLYGSERAETIANMTEYEWQQDSTRDPFVRFLNAAMPTETPEG